MTMQIDGVPLSNGDLEIAVKLALKMRAEQRMWAKARVGSPERREALERCRAIERQFDQLTATWRTGDE